MSVNSNPAASQLNMSILFASKRFSFIAGVVDTGDKPLLSNTLQIFVKLWNGPNWTLRGPEETDL
jgi:hypothetical protein